MKRAASWLVFLVMCGCLGCAIGLPAIVWLSAGRSQGIAMTVGYALVALFWLLMYYAES